MATNMSSLLSTTTNMSSVALKSMLSMPTRFLNHIRRVDDILTADMQAHAEHSGHGQRSPPFVANLPGPWAFLTSGYAITLLAMALLLNRIQHIVVPPRHSLVRRLTRRYYHHTRSQQSIFRIVLSSFFPLNLSSTLSRFILRSPSIYFLWRSLALFVIVLLQASDMFPSAPWLAPAAEWGARTEMREVCWNAFTAVCIALSIDALMRGLEGSSSGSHFNLFGYAFLLHIYSSPITHLMKPGERGPTRPDKHVLVTIIIPLLQLTLLHTLSVRRKWVNQRLVPTSICGFLTLLHFHFVTIFSPTPYPLINYLPSLLESVLLVIIILTVSLHALTQLLLQGRITRPLLGHARTLALRWDEDFAVALLRIGTASLEATSAAGLGNEVVGVGAGSGSALGKDAEVELGRAQLVGIRGATGGFGNEVKRVKAVTANDGDGWIDMEWLREWAQFLGGIRALLKGFWRMLVRAMWKRLGRGKPRVPRVREGGQQPRRERMTADQDDDMYQRFLRGETVSDDDGDGDFVDDNLRSRSPSPSPSPSDTETDPEPDWEGREAAALYADLSTTSKSSPGRAQSPALAPVLLAHVANAGTSPLTRRQYSRLLTRPEDGWAEFVDDRRTVKDAFREDEDGGDEMRRNCVVCTVEAREVICWPCRCLALCDDCRANLASRFPASKHTCPCCRRNVDGYSRIYIP